MVTRTTATHLFVLLLGFVFGPEASARFAKVFSVPGTAYYVAVSEGEFEPRSIGSYAIRLYAGTSAAFPVDGFVRGIILPRDGTIEAVRFESIDGDDRAEIVVVIRSAGSGGYLAADAFRYGPDMLELVASVAGLDRGTNPVEALSEKLRKTERRDGW